MNLPFYDIFKVTILPIMEYGRNGRWTQAELVRLLKQLDYIVKRPIVENLLQQVMVSMRKSEIDIHVNL